MLELLPERAGALGGSQHPLPAKGEYEGVNRIFSEMTGGRLTRVHLHSIRAFPHTSRGYFQNLALLLEGFRARAGPARGVPPPASWMAAAILRMRVFDYSSCSRSVMIGARCRRGATPRGPSVQPLGRDWKDGREVLG